MKWLFVVVGECAGDVGPQAPAVMMVAEVLEVIRVMVVEVIQVLVVEVIQAMVVEVVPAMVVEMVVVGVVGVPLGDLMVVVEVVLSHVIGTQTLSFIYLTVFSAPNISSTLKSENRVLPFMNSDANLSGQ